MRDDCVKLGLETTHLKVEVGSVHLKIRVSQGRGWLVSRSVSSTNEEDMAISDKEGGKNIETGERTAKSEHPSEKMSGKEY